MKRKLLSNPAVKEQITRAVASQRAYELRLAELNEIIHPQQTILALKEVIRTSHDDDEIKEAARRVSELEGEGAVAAASRARIIARKVFDIHAGVVEQLLNEAETAIAELEAEAVAEETKFFARFDLPREATGISARIVGLSDAIKDRRAKLDLLRSRNWETVTRSCLSPVVQWFGSAS